MIVNYKLVLTISVKVTCHDSLKGLFIGVFFSHFWITATVKSLTW